MEKQHTSESTSGIYKVKSNIPIYVDPTMNGKKVLIGRKSGTETPNGKLVEKIMKAANMIDSRSNYSNGNFIVTNSEMTKDMEEAWYKTTKEYKREIRRKKLERVLFSTVTI